MSEIFADSFYWIALANPADAWHQTATNFTQINLVTMLVTTDEVLIEFLNYFSAAGERKRGVVANVFEKTLSHPVFWLFRKRGNHFCAALTFTKRAPTKATASPTAFR